MKTSAQNAMDLLDVTPGDRERYALLLKETEEQVYESGCIRE